MREVWLPCLVSGASFGIVQFLVSNYHGPWLVDIAASIVSIFSLILLLKIWQPKKVWRFADEENGESDEPFAGEQAAETGHTLLSSRKVFTAWMPWVILSVIVFMWGVPQIKEFLNTEFLTLSAYGYLD